MTRKHTSALYLALGMREEFVKSKFFYTRNVEREFGIQGKTPAMESLLHLIDHIHIINPFGGVTNGGVVDTVVKSNVNVNFWHRMFVKYMGLQVSRVDGVVEGPATNLTGSIAQAEEVLLSLPQRVGTNLQLPANYNLDDLYYHGTSGSTLEDIYGMYGYIQTSHHDINERHNFGPGFYAFKGRFRWALSVAFDHCWPYVDESRGGGGSNPSVVVFLCPKLSDEDVYGVHAQLPFGEQGDDDDGDFLPDEIKDYYLELLRTYDQPDEHMEKFLEEHGGDYSREEMKNWCLFVKMIRAFNDRATAAAYRGVLHHSGTTYQTNRKPQTERPRPDEDAWVQHCIQDSVKHKLGPKMLFIEFHVEWDDWKKGKRDCDDETEWQCEKDFVGKLFSGSTTGTGTTFYP